MKRGVEATLLLAVGLVAAVLIGLIVYATDPQTITTNHPRVQAPIPSDTLGVPSGATLLASLPGVSWEGAPETLPVIAQKPGFVEVREPQRPNETTAWVSDQGVSFSYDPYNIVVNIGASPTLSLYDAGQLQFTVPAGPGAAATPTPIGNYFVAFKGQAPNPSYGAFVLVTSAHSDVIQNWGNGDANIGIHGDLGNPSAIGTHVSHGCIRLLDSDLLKLSAVPAGTPIEIVQ